MGKNWELEIENFIFFWGGIFSNWAGAKFHAQLEKNSDYILFNCSEQYMMAQKAVVFNDNEILNQILLSENPKEQKALGKVVKGFDVDKWRSVARDLTYIGCYNKFLQNEKLRNIILSTNNKTLVEASPLDKIWGIGLAYTDSGIEDKNNWLGTNWLGQVLMKVRDDLRRDGDQSFKKIDWTIYE
jgi:ribA/ribD-fused uncharacterized protein